MADEYREKGAGKAYIELAEKLAYQASRRMAGIPIGSDVPIPYRRKTLLQRLLNLD